MVLFYDQAFALNEMPLNLNPAKGQLIQVETDHAKIYFAKSDFSKTFADFKKSAFHDLEEEKERTFTEALSYREK
jgi:hypothetical protein